MSIIVTDKLYPLSEGEQDKRVKIELAVVGSWKGHAKGSFEITQADLNTIVENFNAQSLRLPIDYEHMTIWGDKAPAAGWIISLMIEVEKLIGEVEWTNEAREEILEKKYLYLSPVLQNDTIDSKTGNNIGWTLHSAALTNKPFLEELGEVKAAKNSPHQQQEDNVDEKERIKQLENDLGAARAENKTLKEDAQVQADKAAEAKVDEAIAAKKLHPDQKDSALTLCKADVKAFESMIAGAKPFTQKPNSDMYVNKDDGQTDENALSDEEIKAATGGAS